MRSRSSPHCHWAAAACGDDDDDSDASVQPTATQGGGGATTTAAGGPSTTAGQTTTTGSTVPSDLDPNGLLKFGTNLQLGVGIHFDPNQLRANCCMDWLSLIYGTLVTTDADGNFVPWMAEDVEITDPSTVRITLREGMKFTDGAAYDAEAVRTSLMRQAFETPNATIAAGLHVGMKAMESVDVVDPLTVDVHLNLPIAGVFIEALTARPGTIQSPKQIAEDPASIDLKPIGAGPYTLQAWLPDQRMELRKNPDFFDADTWRIGAIDLVHTPRGAAQATGLLSSAIDFNLDVPSADVAAVEGGSDLEVLTSPGRFSPLLPCTGKPPFDNEKFRQAIQIGIDRVEYNQLVYGGKGEPAYGVFPKGHPAYDPAIAARMQYNPTEARKLLAESGLTDLSFEIATVASNNFGRQAEVLQAQLQKIGITTTIKTYNNVYDEWIQPQSPGALLAFQTNQPIGGYIHMASWGTKGAAAAFCGNEDPELMAKMTEIVQLQSTDPKVVTLQKEANKLFVDHARAYGMVFEPFVSAWNTDTVGGTPLFTSEYGNPRLHFESIYVKK